MLVSLFLTERSPYLGLIPQTLDLARSPPLPSNTSPLSLTPLNSPDRSRCSMVVVFRQKPHTLLHRTLFFGKGQRCSRCSMVWAVLAKPKHRAIGWPLGVIYVHVDPPKRS